MFERHLTRHLREGEALRALIRRSPLTDLGRWVAAGALVCGSFFLLVPLIHAGGWGVGGFVALLGSGLFLAARTLFVWSVSAFVLTDERLVDVDQRGFFSTAVSSASYDRIQDVSYAVRGLWSTLFRIGTVEVQTAGAELRLELAGVRDPSAVQERLAAFVSQRRRNADHGTAGRLLAALERVESEATPTTRPPH